jgi:hypothetical protein
VLDKVSNLRAEDEAQLEPIQSALTSHASINSSGQTLPKEALRARLVSIRAELVGLQEALRRLSRSAQLDASERTQWEELSNAAATDAWKRGVSMATDGLSGYTLGRLNQGLEDVDKDLAEAAMKLSGETDQNRREQLGATMKLLEGQKQSLERAVGLVQGAKETGEGVQTELDAAHWAASSPDELENSADKALSAATKVLDDPTVQQALKISEVPAAALGLEHSIIDSATDITAETVSIKRINALNQDSDEYLAAVNKLQQRMRTTVSQIKVIESELVGTGNAR